MSARQIDWWDVRRKATRAGSAFVVGIAMGCVAVGVLRIHGGDLMRGLADIIIAGFVGLSGVGSWLNNRP